MRTGLVARFRSHGCSVPRCGKTPRCTYGHVRAIHSAPMPFSCVALSGCCSSGGAAQLHFVLPAPVVTVAGA